MATNRITELIETCEKHVLPSNADVVLREPYIPYLPEGWNGILVLAEAQNLSNKHRDYVDRLRRLPATQRMQRLGRSEDIGIQPWDDGSLKLAIEAAFSVSAQSTGCSNAVPWSRVDPSGRNESPSDEHVACSVAFWRELLPLITPDHIVTCGKKAHKVIEQVDGDWNHTRLVLPSAQMLNRVSKLFPADNLLSHFPEVQHVAQAHPEWLDGYRKNKVFFACHAVCMVHS